MASFLCSFDDRRASYSGFENYGDLDFSLFFILAYNGFLRVFNSAGNFIMRSSSVTADAQPPQIRWQDQEEEFQLTDTITAE
ncbi:hypothetical protein LINPERPRIM_LOCUS26842 [Linum perenne]